MKEKKKKNRKLMLIATLVLAVAITGASIGTLAKYITSETASDDAATAKFGLNMPNTIDLFSDSYDNVEADTADKKIIAPGTTGSSSFTVTGASEVAYKVSAEVTVEYSEEWGDYAPLKFSLDGDEWYDLEGFQTKLSAELASETIAANMPYDNAQTIYWEWPFHTSEANDVKDTELGVLAAGGTAPTVTVKIEVTAAQVD